MTSSTRVFIIATALILGVGALLAQEQQPQQKAQESKSVVKEPSVPLQVDVVISRYQGAKKIASVPYMLSVNAVPAPGPGRPSQLRMGSRVPISSPSGPVADKSADVFRSINYQEIGTQIDCWAVFRDDGRYELNISIDDSSIYLDDDVVKGVPKSNEPPIFRQFRASNQLVLRDGQSSQFTAAADRINGEVIRVDVTLGVVK